MRKKSFKTPFYLFDGTTVYLVKMLAKSNFKCNPLFSIKVRIYVISTSLSFKLLVKRDRKFRVMQFILRFRITNDRIISTTWLIRM